MLIGTLFWLAAATASVPPVPGGCTAPAAQNVGKPGCYLSTELTVDSPGSALYWHIYTLPDQATAQAEARRHRWATVVPAHGKVWLYVLDARREIQAAGDWAGTLGPLSTPSKPVTARFMESVFPPGMKTRVHSHSGPEAFFVVEGTQCVETPTQKHMITPGTGFIVDGGPHLQASPNGRKSLVLILAAPETPWMALENGWAPTGYCDG